MSGNRKRESESAKEDYVTKRRKSCHDEQHDEKTITSQSSEDDTAKATNSEELLPPSAQPPEETTDSTFVTQPPQIFRNLTMYLNGSTAPLISDHKLKQVFAQHGGNASISLGRRTVTHVILGTSLSGGGGLASTKIQKEVALVRGLGKGVKYVTAQWVVDSVGKGVRQPEGRYIPEGIEGRLGGSGQKSVRGMFEVKEK